MVEGESSATGNFAGAGEDSSSAAKRVVSSCEKFGDRTRFTVDLRPGETTIVSWKKLMKDASRAEGAGGSSSAPAPTVVVAGPEVTATAHPALEARLGPGEPATTEDEPATNRFSAVIEKIERLYMGKDSDDEDLGDVIPDDDQYDTEDSFIDDAELDEYFEVEKSKTKHDGYFVNRGTLERISEPMEVTNPEPKKRRRKEIVKTAGINDGGERPIKQLKAGRKASGKSSLSAEKLFLPISEGPGVKSSEEINLHAADDKTLTDLSFKMMDGNGSLGLLETNDKTSILAKSSGSMLKEAGGSDDKFELMHKSHSLKINPEESQVATQQKDKAAMRGQIDLNLPHTKQTVQPVKNSVVSKKEGPSAKPKVNTLEKAIRELEKIVAESRPPASDAKDGNPSSQSVKRRLPREIKQKIAKVARISHASSGKVPTELLSRLMGILGHLVQVRTLKRHLKIMMNMSLSVKQEKDARFQLIKKEVVEMIQMHVPSLMAKEAEHQSGGSGELHDSTHSGKAKGQLCMDVMLEDKICDLYDIFVDGLDEDAAPQVRKLYAELAELWPKGVMDNHGIKRAICRAKERKSTVNEKNKDQEKIKRKKVVATNMEGVVRMESHPAPQSQYLDIRMSTEPNLAAVSQQTKFPSSSSYATTISPMNLAPPRTSSTNVPIFEKPTHEKVRGTQNSSLSHGRTVDGMIVKKKVKKRAESEAGDAHLRPEKLASHQGNDRQKLHKHGTLPLQGAAPPKSSLTEFRFEPLT